MPSRMRLHLGNIRVSILCLLACNTDSEVHCSHVRQKLGWPCRCLPTHPSQVQRPTSCAPSWRALQPALCCALPATSQPMKRGVWTRPRTLLHPPPLTWLLLGLGPTVTPTSRNRVGCCLLEKCHVCDCVQAAACKQLLCIVQSYDAPNGHIHSRASVWLTQAMWPSLCEVSSL